jgi:hypothetical protein
MTGGGEITTIIDGTRCATDDMRAAAIRVIDREPDAARLLSMLGLAVQRESVPDKPVRGRRPADPELNARLLAAYEAGGSLREVARFYHVGERRVRELARVAGVLRKPGAPELGGAQ